MDQWTNRLAPHLRALVALSAHDGHMTQAAEALGVPQSSMSRRVHALEKELGIPLLIHDGRIVRLTAAAQRLAKQMREPLRELDSVIGEVTGEADPDQGTVRFGFPLTMGSGRIPDLLAEFRHHHPGIKVLLKQAHGSALTAELLAGDLDLAVVIPAPERLRHVRIGTQRIQVAVPSNHPLAALEQVELADLKHETFIANPPSYNLRQLTETWCREAGYTPDIAFEVTEFATIRELVSRGLGIALLPNDKRIPPNMIELPLVGSQYRRRHHARLERYNRSARHPPPKQLPPPPARLTPQLSAYCLQATRLPMGSDRGLNLTDVSNCPRDPLGTPG